MDEKSKHLATYLRHTEAHTLKLTKEGWAHLSDLVNTGHFTLEELREIVASDKKMRYAISHDGLQIRALQGHSTSQVKMTFEKAVPPIILYHGTSDNRHIDSILKEGLLPMKRHHVHLSATIDVARDVGSRRRGPIVVFEIDTKEMLKDGHTFYRSENEVWLIDRVPSKYLTII
jgi:putative RNA 2'-phosphotransferase